LLKFFWLKGEGSKKKSRQAIHTLRRFSDKGRANVFDSIRVDQVRALARIPGAIQATARSHRACSPLPAILDGVRGTKPPGVGTAGGFAV
jgi:hypothetical protein